MLFCGAALFIVALSACGGSASPPPIPTPTLSPVETLGTQVYTRHCASCHLLTPNDIKVGPSFYGIADRADNQVTGQDARTYLYTSVLNPSVYLADGFEDLMPQTLAKTLTGEELDAVIAYLLTLHN